jgi:hypothetical protein
MAYLRDPQFKRADDKVKRRNDWFLAFNREATINAGWVISSPGSAMCFIRRQGMPTPTNWNARNCGDPISSL